jgi:predicted nucleic acid-binding protein
VWCLTPTSSFPPFWSNLDIRPRSTAPGRPEFSRFWSVPNNSCELRATLRKPAIAARIKPYNAGRLINQLKKLAENIGSLPRVRRSPDPTDDFLLALSEAGKADYLVTGDKSGLLALARHKTTRIISASDFAALLA